MTSWFFVEMAAKSALICSVALLLAMALKHRAAADRSLVLRVGAGLLVALPLIAFALPTLQIEAFAAPALPFADMNLSAAELDRLMALAATMPVAEPTIWDDPTPLLLIVWSAGAIAVLLRLFAGLATLHRWTRSAEPVSDPHWLAALERARIASGASPRLRLMVADKVPGPLGWGWRNPVVLIDHDTYAEPEEADAILAHEVAHVARRDWPALMMTRLATALFWFNPLAWTLARESIHQAEEAADAHAARTVEPTRYAETLLSWGQIGRGIAVPANSIAPGARALSRRVRAVLDARLIERSARSRIAIVAVLLCVGVAGPVAALELVEEARPPVAPAAPPAGYVAASLAHPHPDAPAAPASPRGPAAPMPPEAPAIPEAELEDALATVRTVVPRVPQILAGSLKVIDHPEFERAMREAARVSETEVAAAIAEARASGRLARVQAMNIDHDALERRIRAAIPSAAELERQVRIHVPNAAQMARLHAAMPTAEAMERQMRVAMAASRRGMETGARSMEEGAANIEATARRFRDRGERERIITENRVRGEIVTHEQLIEAADELLEGARGMREGAREMRRSMRGDD